MIRNLPIIFFHKTSSSGSILQTRNFTKEKKNVSRDQQEAPAKFECFFSVRTHCADGAKIQIIRACRWSRDM